MPVKRRWMRWILAEADCFDTPLPWQRGATRGLWRRHLASRMVYRNHYGG